LPAPFSPSRQCTAPARNVRSMLSFARTPGKAFVMPASSTSGVTDSCVWFDTVDKRGGARRPATRRNGARVSDYLISCCTCAALWTTFTLILPERIFPFALFTAAQVGLEMYLDFSSETPPFFRSRL